jgi:hypothetical protein
MSLFLLPKSFCVEINYILRKFWWGFPQEKKHNLSLLSWGSICQPKALGGLVFVPWNSLTTHYLLG